LFQKLNAPIEFIDRINGVELWIKREDKIHSFISGNKWRKLKYYLQDFEKSDKTEFLTFGGAFSNHIAATAYLGNLLKIKTKALVRGEEVGSNTTLDFCRENGMQITPISRSDYKKKDSSNFLDDLTQIYPKAYTIPEGGKGILGVRGCVEILNGIDTSFDWVCCAGGTATTFSGLILSDFTSQYVLYPALKGGRFLMDNVEAYIADYQSSFSTTNNGKKIVPHPYSLEEDYHFGGYGKVNADLVNFMNAFHEKYGIPLDPIYTAKMMFGVMEGIKSGKFSKGDRVLTIHTGGLQGIRGMNKRLELKNQNTITYES
jgi:1-aminocyclopropane-1-carboxylate deaminase